MASELHQQIKWEGQEYVWRQWTDLTIRRLRHFKSWYNADYGKAGTFNVLWLQGDADAYACVIWALLKEAGKAPATPNDLPDFSIGQLYDTAKVSTGDDEEDVPDPTEVVTPRTRGSKRIVTSSEESGSDH